MPSRTPKSARPAAARRVATAAAPPIDHNALAAGWLFDYAALQVSDRRRQAYRRAAFAVLGTVEPLDQLHRAGELQSLRYVGPSSSRILHEVIETGTSETVEKEIAARGWDDAVAELRALRSRFLSMAAAERVLAEPRSGVVGLADYGGDLQMHSEWSDGDQALADIAAASLRLGYWMAAVTDHSHGLPIARGMSMAEAERQHEAIDAVNRAHAGRFVLLKGIEANILADGTTDLTDEERRLFDVVVAAPHSALRIRGDQTARMVAAVSQPGVDILGHPRGRKYNTRSGVQADWEAVFAAAAAHGVAVEIDGSPERQDLDWELARVAYDAGCLFALDSDGHTAAELLFARLAIAHARLAGVPPDRVVNCWPVERLLEWTSGHRR
jgi:putative hydrolase